MNDPLVVVKRTKRKKQKNLAGMSLDGTADLRPARPMHVPTSQSGIERPLLADTADVLSFLSKPALRRRSVLLSLSIVFTITMTMGVAEVAFNNTCYSVNSSLGWDCVFLRRNMVQLPAKDHRLNPGY